MDSLGNRNATEIENLRQHIKTFYFGIWCHCYYGRLIFMTIIRMNLMGSRVFGFSVNCSTFTIDRNGDVKQKDGNRRKWETEAGGMDSL